MREMKDSGIEWIGNVPSNWKLSKIKYMTTQRECVGKYTPEKDKFIGLENVIGFADRYIETSTEYETSIYDVCHKGDILFGRLRPYLAKILTVPFDGYCTGEFLVFDSFNGCKNYLKYVLLSKPFIDEVNLSTYGAKMPRANADFILNMYLPLPQIVEQDKIAGFLDSQCSEIDAISADIQKEIETLEQYKRSVITEAVTKGLNPDVEMKDSGIEWVGNVPDHWGVLANKYVMKKRKDICTKWNGENVLSLTMNGVIVRDLDNPVGKMPTTFDGYQFVYSGNLLMCLFDYDVTPRCVGIVKNAGVTSPAYSRFELKENATLEYFYYYYLMIDFTKELLHLAKNLRHSFTEEQLGALKVPLPPLDEQKNIATYLDSKCKEIESVIASKKQQLEVLDSYKKSLIYEYVTGKKEVPMYES